MILIGSIWSNSAPQGVGGVGNRSACDCGSCPDCTRRKQEQDAQEDARKNGTGRRG
jgi:hypothetical protein